MFLCYHLIYQVLNTRGAVNQMENYINYDVGSLWTCENGLINALPVLLCNGGPGCCDYDPIIERGFYKCEVFEWELVVLSETCLEKEKNDYVNHYYTLHKACPCKIGEDAVSQAISIYKASTDILSFVNEMEKRRVIGRRIWYDADENTIFISKKYACESGGGCPENQTLIGERCHCGHYNRSTAYQPKYYCKCGAEFYRPMFAPIFGDDVLIEPYKTVLSGDDECVLAIRVGKTEEK